MVSVISSCLQVLAQELETLCFNNSSAGNQVSVFCVQRRKLVHKNSSELYIDSNNVVCVVVKGKPALGCQHLAVNLMHFRPPRE